jgi:hypothetical protein
MDCDFISFWCHRVLVLTILFRLLFFVSSSHRRSTLPEVGGATNFRNAGVHVKPRTGNAIFFSYIDPETMKMDNGFTEHSGCPVYEGEKKIVTQWIRYGVDAANPWDSFNTLGVKKGEEE